MIKEIIKNIQQCDDFHNRCDYLLEHDEVTYLIEYITKLQQENQKYKEVIDKAIETLDNYQNNLYSKSAREFLDDDIERIITILKGVK